jgi:ABC-2 type transport system ATP-binding protein
MSASVLEQSLLRPEAERQARPVISVEGITKRFPVRRGWGESLRRPFSRETATVLSNVSFTVAQGEFFGLLGQNGAGKTTLFRILSTLVLPDEGRAVVAGFDAAREASRVRDLVSPVVASERSLYWRLTAFENLRLFAELQRVPRGDVRSVVERALEVVALTDTGSKLVGAFSSGMRQRLLIARSLLGKPRVLLLDEPTRSLDPISSRDFRRFLRDTIVGEQGCTVVLATHDADDVWNLCGRVGVLHRGQLLAVERTDGLRLRAGGDLYDVWVRSDASALLDGVIRRAGVPVLDRRGDVEDGWLAATLEVSGGLDHAASLLRQLSAAGVDVARFEKRAPDLAGILERVVQMGGVANA